MGVEANRGSVGRIRVNEGKKEKGRGVSLHA